jgi:hypothetical protein
MALEFRERKVRIRDNVYRLNDEAEHDGLGIRDGDCEGGFGVAV